MTSTMEVDESDTENAIPFWQSPEQGLPDPMERLEFVPQDQPVGTKINEPELVLSGYMIDGIKGKRGVRFVALGQERRYKPFEVAYFRMAMPVGIIPWTPKE